MQEMFTVCKYFRLRIFHIQDNHMVNLPDTFNLLADELFECV